MFIDIVDASCVFSRFVDFVQEREYAPSHTAVVALVAPLQG